SSRLGANGGPIMIDRDHLKEMFGCLYAGSKALARAVFGGSGVSHPCAYLVRDCYHHPDQPVPSGWPGSWKQHWHLPEPFVGNIEEHTPRVIFVGLNPSIDHLEVCPTIDARFDEWLRFWIDGFDQHGRFRNANASIPLHEYFQKLLRRSIGPTARL